MAAAPIFLAEKESLVPEFIPYLSLLHANPFFPAGKKKANPNPQNTPENFLSAESLDSSFLPNPALFLQDIFTLFLAIISTTISCFQAIVSGRRKENEAISVRELKKHYLLVKEYKELAFLSQLFSNLL